MTGDGIEIVRQFPSNERRAARLLADHMRVAPAARRRGASALLTVGFVPARTAGLPCVMHVFSVHHQREHGLRAWYRSGVVNRGLARARLVIVNSHWAASQLRAPAGRLLVSREGLQHERFSPLGPKGLNGRLPPEYLLWVGNFYAYKRAERALAAYAQLSPELRARFPFVFVGGDWHGGLARAQQAARRLGVGRDARFVGWVADAELPAVYRGARAHVMATEEETFGRSAAEAMACGCPNVLNDLPVLREVAGDAAVYSDFADAAAAGAALRRVLTDAATRAALASAGVARAAMFSFEKLARERIAAIREALSAA